LVAAPAARIGDRHGRTGGPFRHARLRRAALGWEPVYGTVTLLAAIAVHAWAGETLPVAVVPRGIQLIAAGPFKFAAAFRACSIGHFSVHRILQP
jgi:hypothetical protein